ncbi:MAG: phosphatase PAP2 family protein [Methanomassiliicoccales archaeon]|nr:phosphatase PAP2 family protein [Methanomassiliicoccales archaeon]
MRFNRSYAMLVLLFAAIIFFTLLLTDRSIVMWDESLFLSVNSTWNPSFEAVFDALIELGSFVFWFVVIFILWILGKRTLATYLLVAILIHIAIGGSMKYIIDRPRPFEVFPDAFALYDPTDPSFPSGHTEGTFAAAAVLGLRSKKLLIPLMLLAIFVGLSRLYIGVHFPLDVISGAVFGLLIGVLVAGLDVARLQNGMEKGWSRILNAVKGKAKEET